MVKRAIIFIADGTEEMEFTITTDVLRRAGVEVVVLGVELEHDYATCSRGVKIVPDKMLGYNNTAYLDFDLAVVPGGLKGSQTLSKDIFVVGLLDHFYRDNKYVAFICAGTMAARALKTSKGKKVTSYPAIKDQLSDFYEYSEDRVVVDGNLITSRGPGTTFLFALTLVEQLVGTEVANKLRSEMLTAQLL
ncbi:class I glutamine amidotransferase-like protein [Gongronella butleri]|nr:class I glutamine amidotransferase-like protein [Gongronella butleri]